jgi:hypothetical protein
LSGNAAKLPHGSVPGEAHVHLARYCAAHPETDGPHRAGCAYFVWLPQDEDNKSGEQLTAYDPGTLLAKLQRRLGPPATS